MTRRRRRSLTEVYQAPVVIFTLTLLGLVAALLTQGLINYLAVVATGSSLLVIIWMFIKPRSSI